jgi:DNA-binding CsgD family transcriptional regulator
VSLNVLAVTYVVLLVGLLVVFWSGDMLAQPLPIAEPSNPGEVEFSGRELEVLALLREGVATGDIATQLGVAPSTVRGHIGKMMRKAGVETRNELAELEIHPSPREG